MKSHLMYSDEEFLELFDSGLLEPALFTHEAHLRLAWILIRKFGLIKAENILCRMIQNFDMIYGDGSKFNKTVTIASAKVMFHFMSKSKSIVFTDLINEFPRLKSNFKDLLYTHYGFNLFTIPKARTTYMEPDLLPFD